MEGGVQVPRPSHGSARMSGSGSERLGIGIGRWRQRFFRRRAMRRDMSGASRFSLRSSHSSHALFPDEVYESNHMGGGTGSGIHVGCTRPNQMRKTLSGLSSGFLLLDRSSSNKHRNGIPEDGVTTTSISPTTSSTVTAYDAAPSPCDTNAAANENDHDNDNDSGAADISIAADIDSQHRRSFRRTKGTLNLHDYKPDNMRNNNHNRSSHPHHHTNHLGSFHRKASTTHTDMGDDDASRLAPRPSFRKVLSGVLGRLR